jgi:hypothetical protein
VKSGQRCALSVHLFGRLVKVVLGIASSRTVVIVVVVATTTGNGFFELFGDRSDGRTTKIGSANTTDADRSLKVPSRVRQSGNT